GALARTIAARGEDVLQQHDVLRLGDASGRPDLVEHGPGRLFLRHRHLLEAKPRLDVARRAEVIPAAPLAAVPGKRRCLALLRIETGLKAADAVEKLCRGGHPR